MKVAIFKLLALVITITPFATVLYLAVSGSRILDGHLFKIGVSVFCVGALICLFNFYTSFLRYPIHKFKGGSEVDFKFVSGIPFFGLLVLLGMALLPPHTYLTVGTLVLVAIDTLGISWLGISMWQDDNYRSKNA